MRWSSHWKNRDYTAVGILHRLFYLFLTAFQGSYRRRVTLYTFIPLSSLLVFVTFAPLPTMLGPVEGSKPLPHAPYFPFPIPELLVSVSLWSLVHLLRLPLYNFTSLLLPRFPPFLVAFIYNFVYSTIVNTIRISAFPILRVRHQMDYLYPVYRDFAFRRVWWLALGFAAFDAVVGIAQDYSQIALYKTVMIPEENIAEVVNQENTDGSNIHGGVEPSYENEVHPMSPRLEASLSSNLVLSRVESDGSTDPFGHSRGLSEELEREVDHDIEQLVSLKEREDVEQIYGLPIIVRRFHCHRPYRDVLNKFPENSCIHPMLATDRLHRCDCWHHSHVVRMLLTIQHFFPYDLFSISFFQPSHRYRFPACLLAQFVFGTTLHTHYSSQGRGAYFCVHWFFDWVRRSLYGLGTLGCSVMRVAPIVFC